MKLNPISSVLLVLPLICASSLLTSSKGSALVQNQTECTTFSRDNYVLSESNASYISFEMGNSTLVVYCEDLAFNFDKNESEMKRDFSFYSNYNSVNGTYTKGFYEAQYKLVKEQEQQIEAFKKTTNGANNRMILYFDKGRLATKWLGLGHFIVYRFDEYLYVNFTIPTKNGTENGIAWLEEYEDKRFIVERVAGPVDCMSTEVKGLEVSECEGNIQIKKFPG